MKYPKIIISFAIGIERLHQWLQMLYVKGMYKMSSIITKVAIVVALIATIFGLYTYNANKKLTKQVSDKTANIKSLEYGTLSYRDQLGKYHSQSILQNNTIAGLKQSKDSLNTQLVSLSKKYKFKLKDVTQQGQVTTQLENNAAIKINTIIESRDTTYELSSPPYIKETIEIKDDSLKRYLGVYNKQDLIWHTKRETIDPPNKFFLFRWFQKKQNITYVDIINDNPFIHTTSQQFQIITK